MERPRAADTRLAFLAVLAITVALSLAAVFLFDRAGGDSSLFKLANFVGPTAESLLHGQGLLVCSDGMGTVGNPICFHAARMPFASAVIALGVRLLGDHTMRVGFFKALLLLLPLELAIFLACRRLPASPWRRALAAGLLVLPFFLTTFLADVVNLQVEEGYSYSLLALAVAVLFFPGAPGEILGDSESAGGRSPWARCLLFGVVAAGLYLTKSSMAPAVAVLTLAFVWQVRGEARAVVLTLAVVLAAPLGWAAWQHHAAGRYTLGTSVDGENFHKGNSELFLPHYPPRPGESLDVYDPLLNRGHQFPDEWSFNDFHRHAAVVFIETHPGDTVTATGRKLYAIFLSPHKLGSKPQRGALELVENAGVLVFRLLLWAALLAAAATVFRRPAGDLASGSSLRFAGGVFLLLVGAVALPYVVGFAYTRHVSVLIYPSVLLLVRALG